MGVLIVKYMGSKKRIAKYIVPIMINAAKENNIVRWVEPFVGGGNVIQDIPTGFIKIGCDISPHTISAMLAIRDFPETLPDSISEEYYLKILGKPASPIESWVRFVCSVGGKFENGYARDKTNRNYASEGKRNAMKQSPKIQDVDFICCDYTKLMFTDSLIYCDPPYKGTTGYKTGNFDSEAFFQWCRDLKNLGNIVFVSEYQCPEDFTCVWQGVVKTNFSSGRNKATHNAVEKLFLV